MNIVNIKVLGENTVEPEKASLDVGARIRWTNNTADPYVIHFHHGSPFEGGGARFELLPHGIVTSSAISKDAKKGELSYQVKAADELELESLPTPPQDPTVIIRDPQY